MWIGNYNLKNRDDCALFDEDFELKEFRNEFIIPNNAIYMAGSSLGLCPKKAHDAITRLIKDEWAVQGIEGFSKAGWFTSPQRVGNKIGKLIGSEDDDTLVGESLEISIFKCLSTSVGIQKIDNPTRRNIVLGRDNLPTNNYATEGFFDLIKSDGYEIRYLDEKNPMEMIIDEETVVVLLSLVNFRTGELYDIKSVTERIHQMKAHVIWDLSHAVGSIDLKLSGYNADFAFGCTDKYLNSGPGSPSFIWVNKKHQNRVWQVLTGWYSHEMPFKMDHKYTPAKGIKQFLTGTPNIMSTAIVECSVEILQEAGMDKIRQKSLLLSDLFINLMETECPEFNLLTPKDRTKRGSHVSYKHERSQEIRKILIEKDLVCDFCYPDIICFAMAPLYLGFADVWDAVKLISSAIQNL